MSSEEEETLSGASEVDEEDEEGEDVDEEEDEEYDDEEEEEEERPRKKRRPRNSFIDEEVEEDDDEEEEYYEDDEDTAKEAREAQQLERMYARRQRERNFTDRIAARYEKTEHGDSDYEEEGGPQDVLQQGRLPSVKDPKLWMVKCKHGQEKAVTMALMRKFLELEYSDTPLQIKSAIAVENIKGYIYVEAYNQNHVQQAIKGLQALALGQRRQELVPIEEMTTVLKCVKRVEVLPIGSWVRLKRTMYKDDLAQVVAYDESRAMATVKLIPRLDYEAIAARERNDAEELVKRKRARRPAQRLFDAEEVSALGGHVQRAERGDRSVEMYDKMRFKDGFLLKTVYLNALVTSGVQPTLEELRKFKAGDDDAEDGAAAVAAAAAKATVTTKFSKGDVVLVTEGDLVNLLGVVDSVAGNMVKVIPKHEDFQDSQALDFPDSQLRKYFKIGDHVKVINGVHEGETGLVLKVVDDKVTLLGDLSMEELRVFVRDLQLTTEVSAGVDSLGLYVLHDLVQINPHTVGCIVKVEREAFRVVDQQGQSRRVRAQEVTQKRSVKDAVALDSQHNQVKVGDVVNILDGPNKGIQGTVKHIFRSFLFLHSREKVEDSGIFVVRAKSTLAVGASRVAGNTGMGARMMTGGFGGDRGRGRGGPMGRGRGRGRDPLVYANVTITQGPFKGYQGVVQECTETTARVQLDSMPKTITVDRVKLVIRNKDGSTSSAGGLEVRRPPVAPSGGMTPAYGSQTPAYGSRTPAYGAQTPRHDGGMTPSHTSSAWNPASGATPGIPNTPGGEYGEDYDGITPGYAPRTPGTAGYSAATPGSYNPATPGGLYHPTTPGLESVTPGTHYNATTPGMGTVYNHPYEPSTPGAGYNPSTPGGNYTTPGGLGNYETPGHPLTPGAAFDLHAWVSVGIEVTKAGKVGVITDIEGTVVHVRIYDAGEVVRTSEDALEPVRPKKGDRARVIRNENKGAEGEVKGINMDSAIFKRDNEEDDAIDMKLLDDLAKLPRNGP